MKTRKVMALAGAGVLAVSMMTGCGSSSTASTTAAADIRYKKEEPAPIRSTQKSINLTAWKGEKVSAHKVGLVAIGLAAS